MNIQIYHHVYLCNHWKQVLIEQLYALQMSGLFHNCKALNMGVVYQEENDISDFKKLIADYDIENKINILYIKPNDNHFEGNTAVYMKEYCDSLSEEESNSTSIMYLHTKGVSYPEDDSRRLPCKMWKNYMEYFVIFQWKDCIEKLNGDYESCGCEWRESMGGHYSGTFWWMKATLIKKIPAESFTVYSPWTRHCVEALPGVVPHNRYELFQYDTDLQNIIAYPSIYIKQ